MATFKWTIRKDIETVLDTALDALIHNGNKITTVAFNNTSDRYMYADYQLYLGVQTARTAAGVALYILRELDGTNYEYGGDSLDPASSARVGNFLFDLSVTARYANVNGVLIPPGLHHTLIINETGQTFAATLNTLKRRLYSTESS
jgi:hypothetical protein